MEHRSLIDPTRQTAGAIYRDAQINGERGVVIGDINYEIRKSLVVDLNETIAKGTEEFEGRVFYITVYEKKDLMMKNAIIRKLIKTKYRPYPEADTSVYKVIPSGNEVYFCWSLPARFEMINMLNTPELRTQDWEKEDLKLFRHWENDRLEYFGFCKNEEGNWKANPLYSGDKMMTTGDPDAKAVSFHRESKS